MGFFLLTAQGPEVGLRMKFMAMLLRKCQHYFTSLLSLIHSQLSEPFGSCC